ncbi:MAG: hypothetical protein ABF990_12820 [Acetobacter sp.]|uniref:hypothetical protein n=1 Tax=Acetobacter sp. TaxID=440 RepID=UPI0039E9F94A
MRQGPLITADIKSSFEKCPITVGYFDTSPLSLDKEKDFRDKIKAYNADKILVLGSSNAVVDYHRNILSEKLRVSLFDTQSHKTIWAEDLKINMHHTAINGIAVSDPKKDACKIGDNIVASLSAHGMLAGCNPPHD